MTSPEETWCPTCGSDDPRYYHDGLALYHNDDLRCSDSFHSSPVPERCPSGCGGTKEEPGRRMVVGGGPDKRWHEACTDPWHDPVTPTQPREGEPRAEGVERDVPLSITRRDAYLAGLAAGRSESEQTWEGYEAKLQKAEAEVERLREQAHKDENSILYFGRQADSLRASLEALAGRFEERAKQMRDNIEWELLGEQRTAYESGRMDIFREAAAEIRKAALHDD